MSLRERVQRAIASPVDDAERLLAQTPHAGDHERLTILIEGWFRGLAGALEELAIEVDELRRERFERDEPASPEPHSGAPPPAGEPAGPARGEDTTGLDEAALAERARTARKETEALREDDG